MVLSLATLPLSAQLYSGPLSITLSSQGTENLTEVSSSAWVGRMNPTTGQLTLMVKTPVMALGQSPEVQQRVQTALMSDVNPLMVLEMDLSSLNISADALASYPEQSIMALVQYNGQRVEQPVILHLQSEKDGLRLDLEASLSLQALGLPLPAELTAEFADFFRLSTSGAILPLR